MENKKLLNDEIWDLFWKMINHPDKISNIKDGYIEYDNGLSLRAFKKKTGEEIKENDILCLDNNTFSRKFFPIFEVVIPDTDKLIFYINTPYRTYTVPEIKDRMDYARALNAIDKALQMFEKRKISEYLNDFDSE